MKSSPFGAAQTAAGLSRMTLMRPFSNLIDNLKRMGVQYIVFHSNDGQDHQIHLSAWREEHVFQGIRINGKTLCPNVTSAFLNPFLPQPILVVTCDIIELPERKLEDNNETGKITAVIAESVVAERQPDAKPAPFQAKVHPEADKSDKSVNEKKKGGSSCHQCKNVKALEGLVFCQRKFDRRHRSDKRNCRKKYCPHCLFKFYTIGPEQFSAPNWFCPSCSGICRCAACARQMMSKSSGDVYRTGLDECEQAASSTYCPKPDDGCIKPAEASVHSAFDKPAPNLHDALELQGQFSNFTHSSPTSSDENNEMLNAPSAGAVVEVSSSAGENLSNPVIDDFRPTKRLRADDSEPI